MLTTRRVNRVPVRSMKKSLSTNDNPLNKLVDRIDVTSCRDEKVSGMVSGSGTHSVNHQYPLESRSASNQSDTKVEIEPSGNKMECGTAEVPDQSGKREHPANHQGNRVDAYSTRTDAVTVNADVSGTDEINGENSLENKTSLDQSRSSRLGTK